MITSPNKGLRSYQQHTLKHELGFVGCKSTVHKTSSEIIMKQSQGKNLNFCPSTHISKILTNEKNNVRGYFKNLISNFICRNCTEKNM